MAKNPLNVSLDSLLTIGLAALLCALTGPSASAQSESQIRQQGARQAQQIKDLEAELVALQTRVHELETQLEEILARLDAQESRADSAETGQPSAPAEGERGSTQPTEALRPQARPKDVFQSPDTVLATLRWDFEHDLMKDPSFALGVDSDNERAKAEAASALRSWITRTSRLFRKPITWSVKILDVQPKPDGSVVYILQPLAPDGSNAGKPFMQPAAARIARRVRGWQEQPDLKRLLLKGTLEPNLTVIRQQRTDTTINTSVEYEQDYVHISPYVQFDFTVRLSSMMPIFVERTQESESAGETKGEGTQKKDSDGP